MMWRGLHSAALWMGGSDVSTTDFDLPHEVSPRSFRVPSYTNRFL